MKKDVLLTVSGLHYDATGANSAEETEPIEIICHANYYLKNDKHYLLYDEIYEGSSETIKNTLKITMPDKLEMIKRGLTETHMIFEKEKITVTDYQTPYGNFLLSIYTSNLEISLEDTQLDIKVWYELDMNQEKVADCEITIHAEDKI